MHKIILKHLRQKPQDTENTDIDPVEGLEEVLLDLDPEAFAESQHIEAQDGK